MSEVTRSGSGASLIPVVRVGTKQMLVEVDDPASFVFGRSLVIRGAQHTENNGSFRVLDYDDTGVYVANSNCVRADYAKEWEEREIVASTPEPSKKETDAFAAMIEAAEKDPDFTVSVTKEPVVKKDPERKLVRGDVVRLKSGGPLMTVERVNGSDGDDIKCVWFTHQEATSKNTDSFHRELLALAAV